MECNLGKYLEIRIAEWVLEMKVLVVGRERGWWCEGNGEYEGEGDERGRCLGIIGGRVIGFGGMVQVDFHIKITFFRCHPFTLLPTSKTFLTSSLCLLLPSTFNPNVLHTHLLTHIFLCTSKPLIQ